MITIDGTVYDVPIQKVTRTADFLYKYADRAQNGVLSAELIGVYFNYKLQFARGASTVEYAALWKKLTEAVVFHTIIVPDEDGDFTFSAYFANVADELVRAPENSSKRFWKNLTVNFIAKVPARS